MNNYTLFLKLTTFCCIYVELSNSSVGRENNKVIVIPNRSLLGRVSSIETTQTRVDMHKLSRVYLLLIICDYIRVRTARSGEEQTPGLSLSSCVAFMDVELEGHAATADP